jgi:hypothetical protein
MARQYDLNPHCFGLCDGRIDVNDLEPHGIVSSWRDNTLTGA